MALVLEQSDLPKYYLIFVYYTRYKRGIHGSWVRQIVSFLFYLYTFTLFVIKGLRLSSLTIKRGFMKVALVPICYRLL